MGSVWGCLVWLMTWKKKELKLDIQKTFQVLVLFGFNCSNNSNQVKKAGLWSNPRLLFGPFRRKGIEDCGQFWGQLGGGSLCASSSTREVRLWPNFSNSWKSNDNTSHQEPGYSGLKPSTPTEPEIPLAPAVAAQEVQRAQRITVLLLQALP